MTCSGVPLEKTHPTVFVERLNTINQRNLEECLRVINQCNSGGVKRNQTIEQIRSVLIFLQILICGRDGKLFLPRHEKHCCTSFVEKKILLMKIGI